MYTNGLGEAVGEGYLLGAVVWNREGKPGPSGVFERLRRLILEGEYGPNER